MSQIAPALHREAVAPVERKAIPKKVRLALLVAFKGRCAICGEKIAGPFDIDHALALFRGGKDEWANWRPAHPTCHRQKTATDDAPTNAKIRRQPLACLPRAPDEIEPSRLQGRGFDKRLTKGFDGKVRTRKQLRSPLHAVSSSAKDGAEDRRSDCEVNNNIAQVSKDTQ